MCVHDDGPSHNNVHPYVYHVYPCASVHVHAYTLHSSTYIAMNVGLDDGFVCLPLCGVYKLIRMYVCMCVHTFMYLCVFMWVYECVCFCMYNVLCASM